MARGNEALGSNGRKLEVLAERLLKGPLLPGVQLVDVDEASPSAFRWYQVGLSRLACSGPGVRGQAVLGAWKIGREHTVAIHRVGDGEYDPSLPYAACATYKMTPEGLLWADCSNSPNFQPVPDDEACLPMAHKLLELVVLHERGEMLNRDPLARALQDELASAAHSNTPMLLAALEQVDPTSVVNS